MEEFGEMSDLLQQILSKRSKRTVDFDRDHLLRGIISQLFDVEPSEELTLQLTALLHQIKWSQESKIGLEILSFISSLTDATRAIDMADTLIGKVVEGCSNLDREDRCNLYMTLGNLAAEGISARGGLLPLLNERVMEMMVVDATSSEQEQN